MDNAFKFVVLRIKNEGELVATYPFDYDDAFAVGQAMKQEMDLGNSVECFGSNEVVDAFDRRNEARKLSA